MTNFYKDKVIIVTGASSGIGLASVRNFASLGAKVVLAARSIDKLEKIAEELNNRYVDHGSQLTAHCIKTDVTKEEDCKILLRKQLKHLVRLTFL